MTPDQFYRGTLMVLFTRMIVLHDDRRAPLTHSEIQRLPPMYASWRKIKIVVLEERN